MLVDLSSFAKAQRKKISTAKGDQQRRAAGKMQAGNTDSPRSPAPSSPTGPPPLLGGVFPFSFGGPTSPFPFVAGGMEDVD